MSSSVTIENPDNQTQVNSSYLLEVKTVQSPPFRCLIEALKEILTDANLEFDETGIKIIAMDASHTVLVHLKLEAKNFESYYCPKKIVLGIGMLSFFKLIKKSLVNSNAVNILILKRELI